MRSRKDKECRGDTSHAPLNDGNNDHCHGKDGTGKAGDNYKFGEVWGGGWHRGAVYTVGGGGAAAGAGGKGGAVPGYTVTKVRILPLLQVSTLPPVK